MSYHPKIKIPVNEYPLDIREFGWVRCYSAIKKDTNTMDVRYRELHWLAKLINEVGFNLEFGVYSGRTINCLSSSLSSILPSLQASLASLNSCIKASEL